MRHLAYVDSTGPWSINVLLVDLRDTGIVVSASFPAGGVPGRERTSLMAGRDSGRGPDVVGAINADFYAGPGFTISPHVTGGEIIQTGPERPSDSWSSRFKEQFGMTTDRRVFFQRVSFTGKGIFQGGGIYRIAGINSVPAHTQGITMRTHHANPDTVASDGAGGRSKWVMASRIGVRLDTTLAIVSSRQWDRTARLDTGSLVLQWDPDSVFVPEADLEPGDTLRIVLQLDGQPGEPDVVVGGLPRLVIDGKLNPALSMQVEGPPADFGRKRHPRTGVGISRDSTTLVLLTVDGRQAGSAGMTLQEFGDLMISLGIHQGLNLDGGGSTTMVFEGKVVNSPSDQAGERAVANCLIVSRKPSPGQPHRP